MKIATTVSNVLHTTALAEIIKISKSDLNHALQKKTVHFCEQILVNLYYWTTAVLRWNSMTENLSSISSNIKTFSYKLIHRKFSILSKSVKELILFSDAGLNDHISMAIYSET